MAPRIKERIKASRPTQWYGKLQSLHTAQQSWAQCQMTKNVHKFEKKCSTLVPKSKFRAVVDFDTHHKLYLNTNIIWSSGELTIEWSHIDLVFFGFYFWGRCVTENHVYMLQVPAWRIGYRISTSVFMTFTLFQNAAQANYKCLTKGTFVGPYIF